MRVSNIFVSEKELAQAVSYLCFSLDDFFQKDSPVVEIEAKCALPSESSCQTYHKPQIKTYNHRVKQQLKRIKK